MRSDTRVSSVIATVCARHRIRLDEDDPAIITVEIARVAMEESVEQLLERASPLADRIKDAGIELTRQMAATGIKRVLAEADLARQGIAQEAQEARRAMTVAFKDLALSQRREHDSKWFYAGMLLIAVTALVGFAAGYAWAPYIDGSTRIDHRNSNRG